MAFSLGDELDEGAGGISSGGRETSFLFEQDSFADASEVSREEVRSAVSIFRDAFL